MNGRVAKRIDGLAGRAGYSVEQTRTIRRMYNRASGRDRQRLLAELEGMADRRDEERDGKAKAQGGE
jgi:hypothetical protein